MAEVTVPALFRKTEQQAQASPCKPRAVRGEGDAHVADHEQSQDGACGVRTGVTSRLAGGHSGGS